MILRPTPASILEMHARSIERYGGEPGYIGDGETKLDSAIGSVLNECYLLDTWERVHVASLYRARVVMTHALIDRNKRVAVLILRVLLFESGLVLDPSRQFDLCDALIALITHEVDEAGFESRIRPLFGSAPGGRNPATRRQPGRDAHPHYPLILRGTCASMSA